ncbi:TetR/AcrR family transcriptional regulator [Catenulispora rubra]|uniref:TetR/AcrR family transcriptional regulator n=1 Tax=Catenulispora rubra TaxID=280293 RepID=UPI002B264F8B|nr:TetR/AcrR family transcriptional regulator [Catenulispora rubra]
MSEQRTGPIPHKERLLRQGMKLFYAHGYHGTTVDAILEASGVPKGSFYYHFGSKEAFGKAVLARYIEFQVNLLGAWTAKEDLSTSEKLTGYYDEMVQTFIRSGYRLACLAGKFSTELSVEIESFREQLATNLHDWHLRLRDVLEEGQERGDVRRDRSAEELADALLAMIQGAFVISLSLREDRALLSIGASISVLIDPPRADA